VSDGHEVAAFKRNGSGLFRLVDIAGDIAWYDADSLDLTEPFKLHEGFDAVIHTATCYGRHGESSATIFNANAAFPARLLDASVYFDTGTFFNTDTYFNTDTILNPYLSLYALSKKQFAEWGKMVAVQGKTCFVNIRLEHIYGPQDDPSKFTTHIVRQCLNNIPTVALTAGDQLRDFIFIDDAVDAYSVLLEKQHILHGGDLQIGLGSGTAVTIKEFVETVHAACNSTSKLAFGALPYREHEIMQSVADISHLNQLGWKIKTKLEEGIKRLIEAELN
jgi:nucleoside-diphosphate-sugar epimerase